jgi:hypothetical protein
MQYFVDAADDLEEIEEYVIWCIACDLASGIQSRARIGNVLRDRAAAIQRYSSYTPKDFKRRFRMKRYQFEFLIDLIRHEIEPNEAGKLQAIRSSGSYVTAELRIPPGNVVTRLAILRWFLPSCLVVIPWYKAPERTWKAQGELR